MLSKQYYIFLILFALKANRISNQPLNYLKTFKENRLKITQMTGTRELSTSDFLLFDC